MSIAPTVADPVVEADAALEAAREAELALLARLAAGADVPAAEFNRARDQIAYCEARRAAAGEYAATRRRREFEARLPALRDRLARRDAAKLERLHQRVNAAVADLNRALIEHNREVSAVRDELASYRDVTTPEDRVWTSGVLLGGGCQIGNGEPGTPGGCLYGLAQLLGGWCEFHPVVIPEPEPAPGHLHEFTPMIDSMTRRLTGWHCRTCDETVPADRFPAPPSDGFAIHKVRA